MKGNLRDASDAELLRESGVGSDGAFRVLMDRHADHLFRLAGLLVGNAADAEDVLQEALAGAYRNARQFEGRSSVRTWMKSILVTHAARWHRDRKRRRLKQQDPPEEILGRAGSERQVEAKIDLHAALRKLSREHREVLVLREFEALAYADIAALLGVPVGTVESRLHRARCELREMLKDYLP